MTLESVAATLRAARELIADQAHWTQHAWAKTANGYAPPRYDVKTTADLVSYCALGALTKVDGKYEEGAMMGLYLTADRLFNKTPIAVNDTLGHEAVLRMFDAAIAEAEGSQS